MFGTVHYSSGPARLGKSVMRTALVCGAGGFIGSHLVKRLKAEGLWVRGVDLKSPEFSATVADDFAIGDLRDPAFCAAMVDRPFDEVYQLAADMGGAGFIFTGEHDAEIMHNSATINLNTLELAATRAGVRKFFYSSSACVYPAYNQEDPNDPNCSEASVYPAAPDSEYGWEKLFSERLYLGYSATTASRFGSPASITFLVLRALGRVVAKKRRRPCAAKWPRPHGAKSRSGVMARLVFPLYR